MSKKCCCNCKYYIRKPDWMEKTKFYIYDGPAYEVCTIDRRPGYPEGMGMTEGDKERKATEVCDRWEKKGIE